MKRRLSAKPKYKLRKTFLIFIIMIVIAAVLLLKLPPVLYPISYNEEVRTAAATNDVDPMLVFALIKAESNFQPEAVSKSGAVGLMQLMPDTAAWIAGKTNLEYDKAMLSQPQCNIQMGTWYLSYLLEEFNGDIALAIVSYNAGYGRVKEWLKLEIWDGTAEDSVNIPYEESRDYLRRVLANYDKYKSLYEGFLLIKTL